MAAYMGVTTVAVSVSGNFATTGMIVNIVAAEVSGNPQEEEALIHQDKNAILQRVVRSARGGQAG